MVARLRSEYVWFAFVYVARFVSHSVRRRHTWAHLRRTRTTWTGPPRTLTQGTLTILPTATLLFVPGLGHVATVPAHATKLTLDA